VRGRHPCLHLLSRAWSLPSLCHLSRMWAPLRSSFSLVCVVITELLLIRSTNGPTPPTLFTVH
jgi:hypothetical protein